LILEQTTFFITILLSIPLLLYLIRNEVHLKAYPLSFSLLIFFIITINNIIPLARFGIKHSLYTGHGCSNVFSIMAIYALMPIRKKFTCCMAFSLSLANFSIICFYLMSLRLEPTVVVKQVKYYFTVILG
jgi:hypothetical protein